MKLEVDIATLKIDTTKEYGSSASGKSIVVASSRGNKQVEDTGVFIGINVYKLKK
ncbi:MAG: hypothetical protein ACTSYB_07560 [Candidatus Helarchaeota archaeon]